MPYTSRQIVSLACQIAKVQSGMVPQVGQFLNMLLESYAQTMDLDKIRKSTTINVVGGVTGIGYNSAGYLLPTDYLRENQALYNVNGTIFDLSQISLNKYLTLFQGTGIANYPEWYATDISDAAINEWGAPVMYFWPPAAIPLSVTFLYRPESVTITSPETSNVIPWFENQLILLKDLSSQAMMLGDDARKDGMDKEVESRMRKYLVMKDDSEGFAQQVKLDPQLFRRRDNLNPTKITSIF